MPNTGTVDERIVEMRIDHQKFEAGAKKTIGILEKLDDGLRSLGRSHSDGFDTITESLDKVTNKFSVFGTIGDQVIRNLTTKAMELAGQMTRLGKELTIDQVGAGWSKYADKTSAIQTIMAATAQDWEDQGAQMAFVNEQLEKLNWFTDETSYSFLDMVNNIGKFTSNGIELTKSVTAMEGISTWAAISGANVNEASRAMYNLSQALATGSVKLIDWKSIENANMATREFKETALETAVALGTLKKNADGTYETLEKHTFKTEQFNTFLSDSWFTSDVLMTALDKYGSFADALNETISSLEKLGYSYTTTNLLHMMEDWEANREQWEASHADLKALIPEFEKLSGAQYELGRRAFKAAQEAKTFKEAIDATKDAVSTGWMNLFETMFGGYLEAKGLWTDVAESLWNIFAGPVDTLNDIFSKAFGKGSGADVAQKEVKSLSEKLAEAGYTISDFEKAFSEVDDVRLENIIAQYGSLDEAIRKGAVGAELFRSIIEKMTGSGNGTGESISMASNSVDEKIEELRDVANKVLHGDFKNGEERRQMLEELGYDYEMIQWIAGQIKDNPNVDIKELMGEYEPEMLVKLAEAAGYSEEQIAEMNTMLGDTDALLEYLTGEAETTSEALSGLGGRELFTGGLMNLLHLLEDIGEAFSTAFENVFGDTNEQANKLYSTLKKFFEFTQAIQLTEEQSERLTSIFEGFLKIITFVGNAVRKAFNIFTTIGTYVFSILNDVFDIFKNSKIVSRFGMAFKMAFEGLLVPIQQIAHYISILFTYIRNLGKTEWAQTLTIQLMTLGLKAQYAAARFRNFMKSAEVSKFVLNGFQVLVSVFRDLGRGVSNFKQDLSNAGDSLSSFFSNLSLDSIIAYIRNKINTIKELFSNVFSSPFNGNTFLSNLKGLFGTGLAALTGLGIYKLINKIKKITTSFNDILTSISETIASYKRGGDNQANDLLKIAFAIGILAGSLALVAAIDPNRLEGAFLAISGLFGELVATSKLLSGIGTGLKGLLGAGSISKIASSLIKLSLAVLILAGAMRMISSIPEDDLFNAWATITSLLAEMLIAMYLISSMPSFKRKGVSGLIAMALAVAILAGTLKGLAKLEWNQLLKGWIGISSILLSMMVFMKYAETAKGIGAASLISLALTVAILAGTLKGLAKLEWNQLLKGWIGISSILLSMMVFMKYAETAKGIGAASLISLALTVAILASTLKGLAKLEWNQLLKGWVGISSILLSMMVFMKYAETAKGIGAASLISLALTVAILAGTLKGLAKLEWIQLLKGWVGISSILLSMMVFMKYAQSANISVKSMLVMLEIALVAVVIGGVLSRLARFSGSKLVAASLALSVCIVAIAGSMAILNSFGGGLNPVAIASLLAGVIALIAIGWLLGQLERYDWKKIGPAALVCVLTLVALAGTIALLGAIGIGPIGIGLATLALLVGGISLIVWGLIKIGSSIVDSAIVLADKLHIFAESLKPFVESISAFDESTSASFDRFADLMKSIMISEFWMLIAGVLSSMYDAEALGVALSNFTTNLKPFLINLSAITATHITGAEYLSSLMKTITGAEFWGLISRVLSGLNGDLANKLSSFGSEIMPFINSLGYITDDTVTGASLLSSVMNSIIGGEFWGLVSRVLSGLDGDIASKLSDFGTEIIPFLNAVNMVSADSVSGAEMLSQMMKKIFAAEFWGNIKSWFSSWTKNSNISEVITSINDFSQAIMNLKAVSEITSELSGMTDIGTTVVNGINTGIMSQQASLIDVITSTVSSAVISGAGSSATMAAARSAGSFVPAGIAQGIYNNAYMVRNASEYLASVANSAFAHSKYTQINSPAKAFIKLASYIPAGIAEGIEQNTDVATDSMVILGSSVLAAMQMAMARVATVADDSFEFNPVITPVVDMTNLTSAANAANASFGSITSAMRGSIRVSADNAQYAAANIHPNDGNAAIVSEIQLLSSRLDKLGDAVTNMQIVMDTGALVGATSKQMDGAFGTMQARRGRGN